MFFQSMNQMMTPDVDITLVFRKSTDGRMAVSVLPKSSGLKNEAQNNIVPLMLNGTPEELDAGFIQAVASPVQRVSGLITNMAQFEAQADKAASSGKGTKEQKNKESKEDKEKREKYDRHLKKAKELIEARKHKEAVDALTEARKYAKAADFAYIDGQLEEQKKLMGQGDLFAMMEEAPKQPEPQPSQPVAAQQSAQDTAQTPAEPVQQQMQQQTQPVQQPSQQQSAVRPMQQPAPRQAYGNPCNGYGEPYGYQQPQQMWPQHQQYPAGGGYGQYAQPQQGVMMPQANGAHQPNGQQGYPHRPMPFEHEMTPVPKMADPDDAPPYRPEEYAEYPDFPTSMLQGNYVQPQMM